jgi:hypothetical protein
MSPGAVGLMAASADTTAANTSPPNSDAGGVLSRLSELAWKALPAIGSAIGFVGFVAIVGGAIEWIRFDAASLPATQAVLAVPNQELVVVGALALGVFVPAAMLTVLVVYLIDSDGNATPRTARGLVTVGVAEMAVSLFFIGHHDVLKYVWLGLWLILILLVAGYLVGLVMRDFRRRSKVKHARDRVIAARATFAAAADASAAARVAVERYGSVKNKEASAQADGADDKARIEFKRSLDEWSTAAGRVAELQEWDDAKGRTQQGPSDDQLSVVRNLLPEEQPVRRTAAARKTTAGRKAVAARKTAATKRAAAGKRKPDAAKAPGLVEVEAALDNAEHHLGHAFRSTFGQVADGIVSESERGREEPSGQVRDRLVAATVLAVISAVAIVAGFAFLAEDVTWAAALFIVIALLTAMNVFVARATDKFALYGIAVFFSVLMFGAALTIARTLHRPKVQPVALVRKDNELGVCGVYIAQTSDRVYVGRLPLSGYRPGEIFWVPTSDVDLVSVGQPEPIAEDKYEKRFSNYAESMLARLYKDRAEEAAPALNNEMISEEGKKPASKQQATRIHGLHIVTSTEKSEAPPKKVRSKPHPPVTIDEARCTAKQHA